MYSLKLFWDYIRYDVPRGVKNFWLFRKAIWNYRWYSGDHAVFTLMQTAIADMSSNIETKGIEVDKERLKKVAKMNRVVKLMDHFIKDDFIDIAEKELGEIKHYPLEFKSSEECPGCYEIVEKASAEDREHSRKVFNRASEIEEAAWAEIWSILKGQDHIQYVMLVDRNKDSKRDLWNEWYDGSNLKHWWD